MSEHTPENQEPLAEASQNDSVNQSRRKLTGTALGVAAVFTLASRPVLATNCVAPSAAASGNLSHHGTAPNCGGCKKWNYWISKSHPYKTKKFHDGVCFPKKRTGRANWGTKTIQNVLDNNNTGNSPDLANPVSREFAVTLLNIQAGYLPSEVLDEMKLQQMWNEWIDTGAYQPQAGVSWNADKIVLYLRGLQN
jgi:hypothetical protein